MARKQQLIHFHGSVAPENLASNIAKGEIVVLHPASGATQFGTLNNANELVWFNDYASTKTYIDGLNSAMDKRVKTLEGLTGTTNSALQSIEKGTDGDYVTTTVTEKNANKQSVGVAVKTQKVSEANATGDTKAMGLAEASDVKDYVGTVQTVLEGEISAVSNVANAALKTVTGENAIVATTGDPQSVKVTLKIDTGSTKGNVELVNGENGLSAKVEIPEDNVLGVKDGDKVLALDEDKKLSTTISFSVDTTADTNGKKYLRLKGIGDADLGKVDIADFVKDGMLKEAVLVTITKKDENYVYGPEDTVANGVAEEGEYIKLVWNDDSGKDDPMFVNVSKLVDTYTAKDNTLTLDDHAFSVNTEVIAAVGTSADTKDSNTLAGAKKYAEDAVATAKGKIDAYTVNGKAISGNPTLDATNINVAGNTENSGKTVNAAVEDLYTKVNAAASSGVLSLGGLAGHITLKGDGKTDGSVNLKATESGDTKTISAEIVGLKSAAFTNSTDYDAAGAAADVLGTSGDTKEKNTVYGVQAYVKEVENNLANKNVTAGVPEGETLVSATAEANKVTVSSTNALKTAVTKAGSAIQDVKVNNANTNKITVTKGSADNIVTINIDNMIIDCGEF